MGKAKDDVVYYDLGSALRGDRDDSTCEKTQMRGV